MLPKPLSGSLRTHTQDSCRPGWHQGQAHSSCKNRSSWDHTCRSEKCSWRHCLSTAACFQKRRSLPLLRQILDRCTGTACSWPAFRHMHPQRSGLQGIRCTKKCLQSHTSSTHCTVARRHHSLTDSIRYWSPAERTCLYLGALDMALLLEIRHWLKPLRLPLQAGRQGGR